MAAAAASSLLGTETSNVIEGNGRRAQMMRRLTDARQGELGWRRDKMGPYATRSISSRHIEPRMRCLKGGQIRQRFGSGQERKESRVGRQGSSNDIRVSFEYVGISGTELRLAVETLRVRKSESNYLGASGVGSLYMVTRVSRFTEEWKWVEVLSCFVWGWIGVRVRRGGGFRCSRTIHHNYSTFGAFATD